MTFSSPPIRSAPACERRLFRRYSAGDISVNRENAGLLEDFVRSGKPVAAIRHGVTALLAAKNDAGQSILNGRRVTGASDDEERQMALDKVVPFSLGKRIRSCGAEYICADPWKPHVVEDGMLLTGQNTQSAGELAVAILSAMGSAQEKRGGAAPMNARKGRYHAAPGAGTAPGGSA